MSHTPLIKPPQEQMLTANPVAVFTDDDSVINMLGTREFNSQLREAGLYVIVATTPGQAEDLSDLPLVVTADRANYIDTLAQRRKYKILGVCNAYAAAPPNDKANWVTWPANPGQWLELLALVSIQSTFASTSQMLAARLDSTKVKRLHA